MWRVRNGSDTAKEVYVDGYRSSFNITFTALAHSETFFRSDFASGAATHRLFYLGTQIDVKASSQVDFSDDRMVPCSEDTEPPTVSITADPETIVLGDSSTLSWSSTNAESATIDHGIGAVPMGGTILVSPSETITYTITVSGPGGTTTASATVDVLNSPPTANAGPDQSVLTGQTVILDGSGFSDPDEHSLTFLYQ